MIATIIGGFIFLGSQAWEWSHFIHGSEFGKVELADGSLAVVKGHFGEIENFTVTKAGAHHQAGEKITEDVMHMYQHAVADGHIHNNDYGQTVTTQNINILPYLNDSLNTITLRLGVRGGGEADVRFKYEAYCGCNWTETWEEVCNATNY